MARKITRRRFIKNAGVGAVGLALGPGYCAALGPDSERPSSSCNGATSYPATTPGSTSTAKAGATNTTSTVVVDHISLSDLKSTFAAEVVAGKGHDLVEFIAPPSDFEPSVLDLSDVNQEAVKRFGSQVPVATKSSYNPFTKKFYGFCHGWTIDPGDYRKSLWQKAGMPDGPRTWADLLDTGSRILKEQGVQAGIGLSQELDSNMAGRALLWSYDSSIQDADENVVLDNPKTVAAVKFMAEFYKRALTPEVFSWNPASNNQLLWPARLPTSSIPSPPTARRKRTCRRSPRTSSSPRRCRVPAAPPGPANT